MGPASLRLSWKLHGKHQEGQWLYNALYKSLRPRYGTFNPRPISDYPKS